MRERVRSHEARLERAAALIGLSQAEFAAWHTQILTSKTLSYVEIPQHLDAMTGYSLRRGVYVIRDLDIPKSFGWEVDLNEPGAHRLLALYLPADCGNLSLLKKQPRQSAAATSPPTPTPTPTATPAPTPTPTLAPTPTPTVSAPVQTPTPIVTPAPVVHHHVTIFPYLGAAVIGAAIYLIVHHCTCPTPPAGYTYTSGYCKSHLRGI